MVIQRDAKLTAEIDKAKKNSFQVKLSLWETKNEVMNLTGLCRNEEMEYQRLME